MVVHLIDGTYELFRHFFVLPKATDARGQEIAAVRGVLNSVLSLIENGATHVGVATDHVVESFRNQLYPGYKTSEGVPPELLSQFPILEESLEAMGVLVWPMVEFEADDALASAALKAAQDERVARVFICTPDKDLGQCVSGTRVVQLDRMRSLVRDEAGVRERFGVHPQSIPDLLASSATMLTAFPASLDGDSRLRPRRFRNILILKISRKAGSSGTPRSGKLAPYLQLSFPNGKTRCCIEHLQHCGSMCRSSTLSISCTGEDRGVTLPNTAST